MLILTLEELNEKIHVIRDFQNPQEEYMLDQNSIPVMIARHFVYGKEDPDRDFEVDIIPCCDFDEFFEKVAALFEAEVKFPLSNVAISKNLALLLLSYFNKGDPEDYDDEEHDLRYNGYTLNICDYYEDEY